MKFFIRNLSGFIGLVIAYVGCVLSIKYCQPRFMLDHTGDFYVSWYYAFARPAAWSYELISGVSKGGPFKLISASGAHVDTSMFIEVADSESKQFTLELSNKGDWLLAQSLSPSDSFYVDLKANRKFSPGGEYSVEIYYNATHLVKISP